MISIAGRVNENDDMDLLRRARQVAERAYNLYSGFFVGAAVLTEDGQVFQGTFFENSSGPVGACAEQIAIGAAITAGFKRFTAIAIVGGAAIDDGGRPVRPCGRCRQTISEFATLSQIDTKVICSNMLLSEFESSTIGKLLPEAFSSEKLKALSAKSRL